MNPWLRRKLDRLRKVWLLPLVSASLAIPVMLQMEMAGSTNNVSHSEPVLVASPLALDQIQEIIPLGNLNPAGGHVFPADHIYFDYGQKAGLTVFAPAGGTVRSVRTQSRGDLKIEVQVDPNVDYYLAHIDVEPEFKVGSKVMPGQRLGTVSGRSMLDLGTTDARVRVSGLTDPSRYPEPTLHATSPLSLFSEPLKKQLYAKVRRTGPDKDGRFDLDRRGRLVGNWFHQSLSVKGSSRGEPQVWARQLAFAYDVLDPQRVRVSVGGTVGPAGIYAVTGNGPDPAEVRVESGRVLYRLTRIGSARSSGPWPDQGILLVQLLNETRLRAEHLADFRQEPRGFSEKATVYER